MYIHVHNRLTIHHTVCNLSVCIYPPMWRLSVKMALGRWKMRWRENLFSVLESRSRMWLRLQFSPKLTLSW